MGTMLLATLGTLGIFSGLVAATVAARFPSHRTRLEKWGARLIILGLAMAGFAVPLV